MTALVYINPKDFTDADLAFLDRFAKKWAFGGETVESYLRKAVEGVLIFVRIEGGAKGLIAFEPIKKEGSRELWVEVLVGENLSPRIADLWAAMLEFASKIRADKLRISTSRPGLERVLSELGVKRLAVIFGEDIVHG